MKKLLKLFGVCLASGAVAFGLASCSNVSESFANKINNKAKDDNADNDYTYEDVIKKLGDEAIDFTIGTSGHRAGTIIGVKGVKSEEDLEKKLDSEDDVEGIIVVIFDGKAKSASYKKITSSDLK